MISGSHRRLTAWLGLIAMWLVVIAPTVSRLAYTSRDLVVPVCAATGGAQQPGASFYRIHVGGQHDAPANPLNACGYCSLFAHSAVLLSIPPAAPAVLLLALLPLVVPRRTRFTPFSAFPSGRPRDPPRFS